MTEQSVRSRTATWIRARGVWFWSVCGVVAVTVALLAGTKFTMDRVKDADWYAGIGQWVGGIGSFVAAVIALWIATSDRRRADQLRAKERAEQAADFAREAALVRIEARQLAPAVRIRPGDTRAGVSVRNRRRSRLFEIEIVRVVQEGQEVAVPELDRQFGIYEPGEEPRAEVIDALPIQVLKPDEVLTMFPKDWDAVPADYVAVRYTDESGVRWEVDTDGGLARKVE
ncbi:hypothetical protein [Nocardia sp. MH4]|uniref:hypothetical protein n=1 Tax=Nocardia sp. MH4 TaxID=1768677 RepID=UPI001C4FA48A|nr:hypothetical protein [Nocardia sp. MH4]